MKMEARILWISFLVTFQFYNVECKNNFFEYYYSRHHRGHSTTETVLSSTSDISSEDESELSSSDYTSRRADSYSTTEHISRRKTTDSYSTTEEDNSLENLKYEPTDVPYYGDNVRSSNSMRIGIIVGCCMISFCLLCCIGGCIRYACRRKERKGFVVGNQQATPSEVNPQQNVMYQQHQQTEYRQQDSTQHSDESRQLFAPRYQPQQLQQFPPMIPQFEYSTTDLQCHNPPEAPPPYDFPHKF